MLEAILTSPDLYEGPPMVKPPVVQLASAMLRALGRYVDTDAWLWLCEQAGQQLFWPPNVSGWDDTPLARHLADAGALEHRRLRPRQRSPSTPGATPTATTETPEEALARALASWGSPELRDEHRAELLDFARRAENTITAGWQKGPYRAMRQNALLQLIGVSPDLVLQ